MIYKKINYVMLPSIFVQAQNPTGITQKQCATNELHFCKIVAVITLSSSSFSPGRTLEFQRKKQEIQSCLCFCSACSAMLSEQLDCI